MENTIHYQRKEHDMKPKNGFMVLMMIFIFMGFAVLPVMARETTGAPGSPDYQVNR